MLCRANTRYKYDQINMLALSQDTSLVCYTANMKKGNQPDIQTIYKSFLVRSDYLGATKRRGRNQKLDFKKSFFNQRLSYLARHHCALDYLQSSLPNVI